MKYVLTFCALTVIFSCSKEYGYDVDPEIQPYYDSFEAEASLRGIKVDLELEGIGATVDFIRDQRIIGECQNNEEGQRRIHIDKAFWVEYDHFGKEFIIFHELGHCYLDRRHDNDTKPGNICESIMQSGISGCINGYGPDTREEYLDELFGL